MKRTCLIAAFSLIFSGAFAQITFVKGYVIQASGDTMKGEIKINPKKEFDCYYKVFFRDPSGVQKNYKPEKVKGYGFNGKDFLTSKYEGEPAFYKVLTRGHIMLFEIMYETMQMNEISYKNEYYVAKKEDKEYERLKTNKLKKQLGEMMKDNPDMVENIDEKFEIEKVVDVVNQYNTWSRSK
jgi:hypothetical protein